MAAGRTHLEVLEALFDNGSLGELPNHADFIGKKTNHEKAVKLLELVTIRKRPGFAGNTKDIPTINWRAAVNFADDLRPTLNPNRDLLLEKTLKDIDDTIYYERYIF